MRVRLVAAWAAAFALAAALTGGGRLAFAAPRDPAQEANIDRALGTIDPALVALVHDGNAAMDRGDAEEAVRDYEKVHTGAPNVSSVTRRLGVAEARSGHVSAGITHCRQALAADPSAENHAALAASIMQTTPLVGDDLDEAFAHAKTAAKLAPNAEYAQVTLCQAAVVAADLQVLAACTAKLQKLAPDSAETHVFALEQKLAAGDFDDAQRELELAHAAGLSDAVYGGLQNEIDGKRPKVYVVRQVATWTLVGFVATLFVLFVLGMLVSDTLKARVSDPLSVSRLLRGVSRVLLTVAGLFFYVSAAIVSVVLVLFASAVVYVFLELTHPPRPIQIAAGVVALYVLFAVVRASFSRVPPEDPGTRVDLAKEKALRRSLDLVAKRLGERKIAEVYVRSDASIEVVERGGIIGHLRGTSPRRLRVGAFALEGLSKHAFEALVGCEISNFRDVGTAGGGVASSMRSTLDALCERMRARGVATSANPAWWIVGGYSWLFERISQGAIDLGEVLGDARSAGLHGGDVLIEGLRHLVRGQVDVEARTSEMVRKVIEPSAEAVGVDERQVFDEAWRDYEDRAKRIRELEPVDAEKEGADGPAWALFSDREALEHAMHAELRAVIDQEIGVRREAPSP
jgi:tetratricopeptide (TPR) repeat protein